MRTFYSTRLLIGPHDDGLGAIETSLDFPMLKTPPSRSPLSPLLPWSFVFAFIVFSVFSVFSVFIVFRTRYMRHDYRGTPARHIRMKGPSLPRCTA